MSSLQLLLQKITAYGRLSILAGIALMAYLGYLHYQASGDHAYVAKDKLQVISGEVRSAAEVTVTKKRRRSGERVSDRYFEIVVKPASGEEQKLRLALSVGRSNVSRVIDEKITAMFDADDANFVYDIQMDGKPVLAYETTKGNLLSAAKNEAETMVTPGAFVFGFFLMVIGGICAFFNRRLGKRTAAA